MRNRKEVKTQVTSKAGKLYNRAGLWETKSIQAALKGDLDRAGRLRTKSLQLAAKARKIEELQIAQDK